MTENVNTRRRRRCTRTPGMLLPCLALPLLVTNNVRAEPYGIAPTNSFAWAENIGWSNWSDAAAGMDAVVVRATYLAGYIWAENVGWINLGDGEPADRMSYANTSGQDSGVNVDAAGELSGLAWGENIGWINFDTSTLGVQQQAWLDRTAQRFRGYAWGENVGWINLDDTSKFVGVLPLSVGDADRDGDIDLDDYAAWVTCMDGPLVTPPETLCLDIFDFDGDDDVDLADFAEFQMSFTGAWLP